MTDQAGSSPDPETSIRPRAKSPADAQKCSMARLRTPVQKPYAVKLVESVRRSQPKIGVLGLRDRVDECGWKSIFVGPDRVRVLSKGLVGIECVGPRRKQDQARTRAERP